MKKKRNTIHDIPVKRAMQQNAEHFSTSMYMVLD